MQHVAAMHEIPVPRATNGHDNTKLETPFDAQQQHEQLKVIAGHLRQIIRLPRATSMPAPAAQPAQGSAE